MEAPHRTFDLGTALRAIWSRIPIVLAAAVLGGLGGLAVAATQEQVYTSSVTVLSQDEKFDQQALGVDSVVLGANTLGPFTEAALGRLYPVAVRASEILGGDPDAAEIHSAVTIAPDVDAGVINVSAESSDPERAALIANAYGEAMVDVRRQTIVATIEEARHSAAARLKTLPPGSRSAARLRDELDRLGTYGALQTGNLVKASSAGPGVPSGRRRLVSAVAGAVAGLLIGMAIALLLERVRPRLRSARDAERALGVPVLAEVGAGGAGAGPEGVRMLRARLLSGAHGPPGSILILPVEREAADRLAAELADSAAAAGTRALLIDANLRTDGGSGGQALSELLAGGGGARRPEPGAGGGAADRIGPGGVVADPAALLGGPSMRTLLESASGEYGLVVLSAPSPLRHPDALPLLGLVDEVVIAVEPGAEERRCEDLRRLLGDFPARPSGAVLLGPDGPG